MRTMSEIRQYVADRVSQSRANAIAISNQIAELEAAIDADKKAQHDAATANDSAAYARAITDESFHKAQLEQVRERQAAPAFSPDELVSLGDEVRTVSRAFRAPIYKRMVELLDEGEALHNQLTQVKNDQYAIWSACAKLNGGENVSMPDLHPSVKAQFAPNSNSVLIRSMSDTLNK